MSTPTDSGNQNIIPDYRLPLKTEELSDYLNEIVALGIYSGFSPTILNASDVEITSGTILIQDNGNNTVNVTTTSNVTLQPTESNPYMVVRWSFKAQEDWYADITIDNAIGANDVVIAKAEFNNAGDINSLDLSDRTYPDISHTQKYTGEQRFRSSIAVERTFVDSGTTYTADETEYYIAVDRANAIDIEVPSNQVEGRTYKVADEGGNAGSHTITITSTTSETFNDSSNYTLTSNYANVELIADGSGNWMVLD